MFSKEQILIIKIGKEKIIFKNLDSPLKIVLLFVQEVTQNETWTTLRLFNDTCRDSLPSLNFLTLKSNQTNGKNMGTYSVVYRINYFHHT